MNVSGTALATVGLILLSLSGNSTLQSIVEHERLDHSEANNALPDSGKTKNNEHPNELNHLEKDRL